MLFIMSISRHQYKYINSLLPADVKVTEDEEIILTDFKFILPKLYEILSTTPNRVLVNYLMWRTAASTAKRLNKKIRDRRLEFSKLLSGKLKFEKRWIECVDVVLEHLPIATSALYVRNFFKKESKSVAVEMVDAIKLEFEKILENVPWMDDKTRDAALEKAKVMTAHIAYPDELMDNKKIIEYYGNLTLEKDEFFESILNVSLFETAKFLKTFRKPVNRSDWQTHANVAEINAFYNSNENSIQFPAGIMQGVYFHPDRPKYMNYAAIGSIIGHEITHGFDDEGSQFDSNGNLVDWWEEDTKVAYLEKANCIIEQYGNFTEPQTGLEVNGINTQGENIADNGGVKEAYLAYQKYVDSNGEEKKLPGLNYTTNQLFWISAAQSWCTVTRTGLSDFVILIQFFCFDSISPSSVTFDGIELILLIFLTFNLSYVCRKNQTSHHARPTCA